MREVSLPLRCIQPGLRDKGNRGTRQSYQLLWEHKERHSYKLLGNTQERNSCQLLWEHTGKASIGWQRQFLKEGGD